MSSDFNELSTSNAAICRGSRLKTVSMYVFMPFLQPLRLPTNQYSCLTQKHLFSWPDLSTLHKPLFFASAALRTAFALLILLALPAARPEFPGSNRRRPWLRSSIGVSPLFRVLRVFPLAAHTPKSSASSLCFACDALAFFRAAIETFTFFCFHASIYITAWTICSLPAAV
jgi:hypothetical protein